MHHLLFEARAPRASLARPSRWRVAWVGLLAALATACDGDDDTTTTEPFSLCDERFDTPYDEIVTGLTKDGDNGVVKVRYVSSSPAPPAEGDNAWTVQLLDASGAPLGEGAVTKVQPFMPDHGHGTMVVPSMSAMDADGRVEVSAIDFRMPGVWTLTFTVETAGQIDAATFGICID